jgi:hypothetical protein
MRTDTGTIFYLWIRLISDLKQTGYGREYFSLRVGYSKLNIFFVLSPTHTVSHCSPQPNPTKIIPVSHNPKSRYPILSYPIQSPCDQADKRQRAARRRAQPPPVHHSSSVAAWTRWSPPWPMAPPTTLARCAKHPSVFVPLDCTQIHRRRRTGAGGARLQTAGGRGRRTDEVTRSRTSFEVVPL